MRLTSDQIDIITHRVVHDLERSGAIEVEDTDEVKGAVRRIIVRELKLEDDLNEEVRELMRQHSDRIRRADVEYHSMFKAIKSKLAKEKDIIL